MHHIHLCIFTFLKQIICTCAFFNQTLYVTIPGENRIDIFSICKNMQQLPNNKRGKIQLLLCTCITR